MLTPETDQRLQRTEKSRFDLRCVPDNVNELLPLRSVILFFFFLSTGSVVVIDVEKEDIQMDPQ